MNRRIVKNTYVIERNRIATGNRAPSVRAHNTTSLRNLYGVYIPTNILLESRHLYPPPTSIEVE
jgi:hypothetical protein